MTVLTFQCDLCGTLGRAAAPGAAQCATCGRVALIEAPSAHATAAIADPFATEEPTLLLEDEIVEPPARVATLWVRPGGEDTPTSTPRPLPVRHASSVVRSIVALTAGATIAVGSAVALRAGWIGGDGGARTATETAPAPAAVAQRAAAPAPATPGAPAALARPEPPVPERGRKAARLASTHGAPPEEAGEGASAPRAATLRNPAPADAQCIPRALRARRDLATRLPSEVTVRFPVTATGALGRIEVLGQPPDHDVATAIEEAIRSCRFVPGADEEGRPIVLPVVMRIQFAR